MKPDTSDDVLDELHDKIDQCGCCSSQGQPPCIGCSLHHRAAREIQRLRGGGCARDQKTTQFCAEAAALQSQMEILNDTIRGLRKQLRDAKR